MSPGSGLRERKKRRTRETIVREAMALFARRGFEPTTIAEIAEAADIAPRTFFAYFPSKEAVVFHEFEEVRDRFAARLRERRADETVFDALRAWVAEWVDQRGYRDPVERERHLVVQASPALQAHDRENFASFGRLIAEGAATDLGEPPDALRPRLVAAAAVAALEALRDVDPAVIAGPADALAILDDALSFLQGGLDALRRQT